MRIDWLEEVVTDSVARLQALPSSHAAVGYLQARGVSPAYQQEYRVGWLEVPTATRSTPAFWEWLQKYGWESYVFPLTDPWGATTGIVVRSLPAKRYQNFIAYPKELCPPCFGLHTALPVMFQTQTCVLVEGIFDYFAVRPFTSGVLAQLTSIPSALLRRLLARYVTKVVALADMDTTGRRAAYRLAGVPVPPEYREPKDRIQARIIPQPFHVVVPAYSAHDPSELWAQGKTAELARLVRL
jgi:DNA primase